MPDRTTPLDADGLNDLESRIGLALTIPIDGVLAADQESVAVPLPGLSGTIYSVKLKTGVDEGPVGDSLLVDINLTGNSIFATEENPAVPAIEDGGFISPAFAPLITSYVSGDYLTARVLRVGALQAGSNLRVLVQLIDVEREVPIPPTISAPPVVLAPYQRGIHDTDGVIAYWRFDDAIGETVIDDDIGNYNGQITGTHYTLETTGLLATEDSDGLTSSSVGIGEAGMVVDVPGLPAFIGNDPFSYEGWIKPSVSDSQFRRCLDQLASTNTGVSLINASSVGFYFTRMIGGVQIHADASLLASGTTRYFVVTYDGTTIKLYIDGDLAAQATDTRTMPAVTAPFRIGHFGTGLSGSGALYGIYDEFAVYDIALEAATIADHYTLGSGQSPPTPPPPLTGEDIRTNRTKFSKVAMYAALGETSGTVVTAQKRRRVLLERGGWAFGELPLGHALDSDPDNFANQLYQQAISFGTYMNFYTFTCPMYFAPHDISHIKVTDTDGFLNQNNSLYKWGGQQVFPFNSGWRSADAEIPESTYKDKPMFVCDPNTDKIWETFHTIVSASSPPHNWPNVQATHGGKIDNASTHSGIFENPMGSRATGLSLAAGIVRYEDVVAGEIPGALGFATPRRFPGFRSPANRTDAAAAPTSGNRVQAGMHFWLDPTLDIDAYCASTKASYLAKLIMRAAQKYGIICTDGSQSAVTFSGEDVRNPVTGIQEGNWLPYLTSPDEHKAITGVAATDVITCGGHGWNTGDYVFLFNLAGGAGLESSALTLPTDARSYALIKIDSNTFKLALNPTLAAAGTAVDFTTNITSGQIALAHQGWRIARIQNFPWGNFSLLPPYDAGTNQRTQNTWNDLTGTHTGAVTVGSTSLTTNASSKSVIYAGGKTTFADDPAFDVGAACTIRAMVKTTTVAAGEAIILHRDVYELKRSGSSLVGSVTIGGVVKSVTATSVFSANVMSDVALTYDGADVKLWENGVQTGSSTAATGSVGASSDVITVGSLADGSKPFSGQIQHVEVLQEALVAGRLLADFTVATT